ncbi:lipopolysaccharide transport periplasmic protein LptA [Sneathiella sp. HT1-7]|jgi:lipopolysaccharide export system protein LptA|uniref:lipopolysaccharide transport periplasmic protein LptA n=1 Tax=Sneathiella sp. HT1-7 TaxID=2887192 RepID=UPI001D13C54D|nr:lipopolysaccharide transport periplasmic protein LptA [Sneathiella sp. HT1-7]MCC3303740.1 lipopolysaccharide transport periplasmic protein LptA [Sneathiella sp. HT1-7]
MRRLTKKVNILTLAIGLLLIGLPQSTLAQSALTGGSIDTNQPIEITADSLEVQQANQLAIFEGNVQVVQGEIRMRAAKLMVHYSDKNQSTNGEPANIRQIDALGDVFLSSPRETAQGDKGVYDVTNKQIDLQGNVVLTQGKNVLRGNKLTLDLITGKSRVEGGGATDGSTGRVKGIFVPEKKAGE